jgi:transcription factor SPN1
MWQGIVDNGVLDAVRAWLEPMYPSKALPAVGIQKAFFEVLPKVCSHPSACSSDHSLTTSQMDLDTQTLKECRLGPIILFYTKTKAVTPIINRQADALVQAWSRPIIKRPANFRSKHVQSQAEVIRNQEREGSDDVDGGRRVGAVAPEPTRRKKRFDPTQALKENEGRKGARLYISKVGGFVIERKDGLC